MLARIIEERGLTGTPLGTTAIACAAIGDATAWCTLAVIVAIASATGIAAALLTVFLSLGFVGVMLLVLSPRAARIVHPETSRTASSTGLVTGILMFVFASALITELIGIHALFGAFLAGVVIPPAAKAHLLLKERLELFSSVFLLPLFFAFTGLRTEIGLLVGWQDWLVCASIIAVAITGKFGSSMLAARWTGMSWHDSAALGALMNTRGLMELVVLNIGCDLGILSSRTFGMLVLMALVMTTMTGLLLSLIAYFQRRAMVDRPPLKQV